MFKFHFSWHAVICAGLISIPTTTLADASLNCSAYAGIAVAQQEQNLALNCGFTTPDWSTDFQAHYAWCASDAVKMVNLTTEDNNRKAALAECAARPQLAQEACVSHAQNAILAVRMAQDAQCGFAGGIWGVEYGHHFSWCIAVDQAARDSETAARSNQLQGCLAVRQTIRETECSAYAEAAVIQNQSNVDRKCGFTGGRWSDDRAMHFNWCMSVDAAATQGEAQARNDGLAKQCTKTKCWTETRAVFGVPPWEVVRKCKSY